MLVMCCFICSHFVVASSHDVLHDDVPLRLPILNMYYS